MKLQLKFTDLPCKISGDTGATTNLDDYADYFQISRTPELISIEQTVPYWSRNRPSLGILFKPKKVLVNLRYYTADGGDELEIVTSAHAVIDTVCASRCAIRTNPGYTKISRCQVAHLDLWGHACSFHLETVSVAETLNVDIASGSFDWSGAPRDMLLKIGAISGSITAGGHTLPSNKTLKLGSGAPEVAVTCVGGSVNFH